MLNQQPTARYQRKLKAIVALADRWQGAINKEEWPDLIKLLKKFSGFSKGYIRLTEQMPPEIARPQFVLKRGIDKLLNEWSTISRACEQRIERAENNGDSFQHGDLSDNLKGARKKLQSYCERWNGEGTANPYLPLNEPVVYFEKVYRLSRSVYAPEIPIISIPLVDYDPDYSYNSSEPDEKQVRWTALAHEFGHHIFWNSLELENMAQMRSDMREKVIDALAVSAERGKAIIGIQRIHVSQKMVERTTLWGHWLEEVFADVCGTLLDGPAYALSAQDIAAERVAVVDDLIKDDHEHPAPYLRPLISIQVLEKMAQETDSDEFRVLLLTENGLINQLKQR
ncbi:hypothetical protein QUF58_02535 [Anaerolineales bacterium HSG24]|nr:hypothetical protein [Anaerolineales bacterium HSG24]